MKKHQDSAGLDVPEQHGKDAQKNAFLCRHFRNDRPCIFHKREGVECSSCTHRDPVDQRILLIKLEAPGDVLRTTCLLPSLKLAYPASHITWVTRTSARPLLENNPAIDRLLDRWEEILPILQTEHFEIAINPDADPHAARLFQMASSRDKRGMGWAASGHVRCCNEEAERWLHMGISDPAKKANKETYQVHLHRLCGLQLVDPRPLIHLREDERRFAADYLEGRGIDWQRPVIGLNTGAGNRWSQKSWLFDHQVRFIHLAKRQYPEWQLLLLGGPEEVERNRRVEENCPGLVINTGLHPVRKFAALVERIHVLLTADTLTLHIGLALKRQIFALFGPTSSAEIDLCGLGEKLFAELDCLVCYRTTCDKSPTCMELLAPERVLAAMAARLSDTRLS